MKFLTLCIILIISYYVYKWIINNKEHFTTETIPSMNSRNNKLFVYPVSYQSNANIDNIHDSLLNDKYARLIQILNSTQKLSNKEYTSPLIFNIPDLPVTQTSLSQKDITPIVDYLLMTMNKIGDNEHMLKLVDVTNIEKQETINQVKVNFTIVAEYSVKLNQTFKENIPIPNVTESAKTVVFGQVYINVELNGLKPAIDDIFVEIKKPIEKIYINRLALGGYPDLDLLPGNNIGSIGSKYYAYNIPYSNKITDDRITNQIVEMQKQANQNEEIIDKLNKTINII